jgi:hypothetical protein
MAEDEGALFESIARNGQPRPYFKLKQRIKILSSTVYTYVEIVSRDPCNPKDKAPFGWRARTCIFHGAKPLWSDESNR